MTDAVYEISEHLAALRFEDLPAATVTATKRSIIDTLGVLLAGSGTATIGKIVEVARGWGGTPQSSVWGFDLRLPEYLATWVNASMVHQYDFDDTHDRAVCHPTSGSLTAALAVAEAEGGVDGRTLIAAVAAGNDLTCRIAGAVDGTLWDFPWVRAPVVGIFGAAAAAGVVLGLDADGMHRALGLALPQAGGTLESVTGTGSAVRSIRDGLAYKDAVLAARLAAGGVRGDDRVFDGPYGLFAAFFGGRYRRAELVEGLGRRLAGDEVSIKPWPSCRHTHATLTALLSGLEKAPAGTDVEEVLIHVGTGNLRLCEGKAWPSTHIDALCHLPYVVSVALVHGAVPIDAFADAALGDPAVRGAADRVRWELDPRQDVHGTIEPGRVHLRFADGTEITEYADRALGHPENPMSAAQTKAKWHECLAHAACPPSPEASRALLAALYDLEVIPDVAHLRKLADGRQ
jgi:2-methylcitrate dehydratase PrpD